MCALVSVSWRCFASLESFREWQMFQSRQQLLKVLASPDGSWSFPPTRDTDLGGVQRFCEDHDEFSLGRLCIACSRLIRMRCTITIKPEAERQIYWTMVSIDSLVSIGATSATSLERLVAV